VKSVVVAGHMCLDLLPRITSMPSLEPGRLSHVGAMTVQPGGCVANVGGILAALGAPVRLYADLGSDALAATLVSLLLARGADVSGFRVTESSTSYSIVVQADGHDRTFWHHVGANASFDGETVDLGEAALLHLGYPSILPAMIRDGGEPLRALFGRARAMGVTTSLDLAVIGAPGAASRAWWGSFLASTLPWVDVLTPSKDDLTSATGRTIDADPRSAVDAASWLIGLGAAVVVVSAGSAGMALATGSAERLAAGGETVSRLGAGWFEQRIWLPVQPVPKPATTTGAGDAASAGFLHGLMAGSNPHEALRLAADTAMRQIVGSVPRA
jgi:sugar/nucleoside kinase (ribokinase family)